MTRFLFSLVLLFSISVSAQLKSPAEFLGYELGSQFTRHHEVVDYYEYLAEQEPDRVKLTVYGKTNERRPLIMAYVSSAQNIANLESIRQEHLKSTEGGGSSDKAIVWLSYNVHGNESVSTEASMQTIYELLTKKSSYLENTVVIMDPCINPDGRDRYSNWYNQYKNTPNQVDPNSKEHHEGWWGGRSNHYMFDLNRDWAWLTQVESQQRLKQFNKWMPHVHVDFHEQGVNNPYYFAPAAEPYHEVITDFQRDFQVTLGRNHAKYFDANGWFYFTKEVFDLLYPSYGDTYPIYNGSIGMTYEQGGGGRAGLGIITGNGDTLTLKDRIDHHFTTGISTVEVSSQNVDKLNSEFKKFYTNKNFAYKSYVLKGDEDKLNALKSLLDKHEIEYGDLSNGSYKGYDYSSGKSGSISVQNNGMVVSVNQPKGTLVTVLFEPSAKLSDSLTYDITAWSLPYAYGLDAIASTSTVAGQDVTKSAKNTSITSGSYAYLTDWNSMNDAKFLAELLKEGIRVRKADHPFSIEGKSFARGTLIITKGDNALKNDFTQTLQAIAKKYDKNIAPTSTGFVDSGKDFGSSSIQMIEKPKIAVLSGGPTSTLRFGEIWHFFEQQLHYPLTVLDDDYASRVDLNEYNVLILPDGRYGNHFNEDQLSKIKDWVRNGGKLVAMGGSINAIDGEKGFGIKRNEMDKEPEKNTPQPYEDWERERIKGAITGAIFKAKVDNTNPLAYGYGKDYFSLKLGSSSYAYLTNGNAVYLEKDAKPFSGFAGSEAQKEISESLVFGLENYGRGQVVYMVDNPLFRGFWENGKLFFANALFMVD
ncbi:M14 family metallopeptidase [Flagellimonas zhangzhouensis]|uniref:Zinc carboxypeptidase n=1 Tax=Flagellimonas zhangzhouensis TaxID=1073328 RepID=A0A1H2Y0Y2_9FLAO|nr:M14 family metallopeptidase [Allomuricauda zhangzhouensis]SDQ94197.1 Zinc carboxypeptidase [Allomuricauda zhangzhouensis]SDW98822.1 Zinc carboxypeptidase [Allomuricauda zhangzhouensis]